MEKLIIKGGNRLTGEVRVLGAKNAALKALVAACMTEERVIIRNVPLIADVFVMIEIMRDLGAVVSMKGHAVEIEMKKFSSSTIPLDKAVLARTSSMFLAPLLSRVGQASIPNPGGCRLGARPINRTIDGVKKLNVDIGYYSEDGYFRCKTDGLRGALYTFPKNTHTGTETMILSAVLAKGKTILRNAAEEPEIDDLIKLLNKMGAKIKRTAPREITIDGVEKLNGTEYEIGPDRIEVVTFAIAAILTKGDIFVKDAQGAEIGDFLAKLKKTGAGFEIKNDGIRFYGNGTLKATDITTGIHPGFLTDWQAPWAVLMTQADGESIIHETVFENKLGYIADLKKMGANAKLFNPEVKDSENIYNFNLEDDSPEYFHAVKIKGPKKLHNAVMTMHDIRAGAAVVLAALIASGTSTIFGVEKLDRGYEVLDKRLEMLGAEIKRVEEE